MTATLVCFLFKVFFSRWDHLYIWDGDNIFSGLQAVYSGLVKTKDKSYKTSSVSEVLDLWNLDFM